MVSQRSDLGGSPTTRQNPVFHVAYHGVGPAGRNPRADELLKRQAFP